MADHDELAMGVLYPSEFLKAADLKGKQVTVTVTRVERKPVPMSGGRKGDCVLIHLAKTAKKIICGKTNGYALALLLSPDASNASGRDWVGRRITLVSDLDEMNKQEVASIRIAGSPDAAPERADAYAKAWRGKRKGGDLCRRLKASLAVTAARGYVPPIDHEPPPPQEPIDPGPVPPEDDLFRDDDDPSAPTPTDHGPPEPGSSG